MIKNVKLWIKSAVIRAIKTVAQTFLAFIPMSTVFLNEVNWGMALSAAALAGILSIVTSLAGLPEVDQAENTVSEKE